MFMETFVIPIVPELDTKKNQKVVMDDLCLIVPSHVLRTSSLATYMCPSTDLTCTTGPLPERPLRADPGVSVDGNPEKNLCKWLQRIIKVSKVPEGCRMISRFRVQVFTV